MVEEPSPFVEEAQPDISRPRPEVEEEVNSEVSEPPAVIAGHTRSGPILGGLILLGLGVIFLLRNLGVDLPFIGNWWALFILIPAMGSFDRAWRSYQRNGGRLTSEVTGPFVGAMALSLVAVTFLFDMRWRIMLPVFLILTGVGALLTAFGAAREP